MSSTLEMPKIETVILRCLDPRAQGLYYCNVLGMNDFGDGTVGYGALEARLLFVQADRQYVPTTQDLYWKIALAVPNIEMACQQLSERGVNIGTPRQFEDVGYLAHFTDPEGFTIELIEHWFEGQRQQEPINPNIIGGDIHLNLLTLRCNNIESVLEMPEIQKMTPLSIQPVESRGFTLHFFAFTDDVPPSADLYALENRTWLYQRRYTALEIQHVPDSANIITAKQGDAGYAGTVITGVRNPSQNNDLLINAVSLKD